MKTDLVASTENKENKSHTKNKGIISLEAPQQNKDDSNGEHSEAGSDDRAAHSSKDMEIVQSAKKNDKGNAEVPQNVQSILDSLHWTGFLDTTSDLYWGLNLDNFYWGKYNTNKYIP